MMTGMGEAQEIDYNIIATIESSNSAYAYNSKTQATGLYQITPICLKEWNDYHRDDQYCMNALFDWVINRKIASWYLEIRIPRMLKYYNVPITLDNILWAYNAGIGNVVKGRMPKETKDYIKKYHKLEEVLK
jgi:soluble lytic murein transglycosylase-like protein